MIRDHHEGYIGWEEYERNQKQLALNDYRRAGGVKSGKGGELKADDIRSLIAAAHVQESSSGGFGVLARNSQTE
jgi:hypothetical protein